MAEAELTGIRIETSLFVSRINRGQPLCVEHLSEGGRSISEKHERTRLGLEEKDSCRILSAKKLLEVFKLGNNITKFQIC